MVRSKLLFAIPLVVGMVAGAWFSRALDPLSGPDLAVPALAGGGVSTMADGAVFVSTDGGTAYLWRREGDRILLLGQCSRTLEGSAEQAAYVWLPGVERGPRPGSGG